MGSIIMHDRKEFTQRSVEQLVQIVNILREDELTNHSYELSLEAANAIKSVFDRLAWADGQLDRVEIDQLNDLLQVYPWLWFAYVQVENNGPRLSGINSIPKLIEITKDYDDLHETLHCQRLITALEMIGYGFIAADGKASEGELDTFREYIKTLREYVNRQAPKPRRFPSLRIAAGRS